MHYIHTMVRVTDLEASLAFYCGILGLEEVSRWESEKGRFTNVFLKAPGDVVDMSVRKAPLLELTWNWDREAYTGGRNFGHLAYAVEDIYDYCTHLQNNGVVILRPPKEGRMAFIKTPEGISVELLQIGEPLPPQEPWLSMGNTGSW